jgi:16S rRNA (guanine966-N2)-methyltransferase
MTRIVAGFAGSLSLAVPRSGTRPTSDRVREALFSALDAQDVVRGARVLDLYAGSGALGLEAASRGARSVTLVENHSGAAVLCRKNAAAIQRAAPARTALTIRVVPQSVQAFLSGAGPGGGSGADSTVRGTFELVFLDPPYALSDGDLAANLTALASLLEDHAVVVVERSSRSPEPDWGPGLESTRHKTYGDTTVWYAAPRTPTA